VVDRNQTLAKRVGSCLDRHHCHGQTRLARRAGVARGLALHRRIRRAARTMRTSPHGQPANSGSGR
jgi:hypothetical protein